jgi:hypothetical protein
MKWFSRRRQVRHVRLRAEPGAEFDRYVQLPLTEHFDYLDVLSLELSQQDLFELRSADYGLVAGRVVANEGVGVPNCRVSIFIPASSADPSEPAAELLRQRYPWEKVSADDVDANGRRYNLLPDQASFRGFNGFAYNEFGIGATPVTPLGSFPEREAVLTDPVARATHERYYRYSTVTNEAGDFALLGVPVGLHTLHLDADLTDIGRWSYSPVMLRQLLGYPATQFEEDGKRVRATTDLNSLNHLINLNAQVTVRPLWAQLGADGGPVGATIGVTRNDFTLPVPLRPHFTLGGSIFSMGRNHWWGDNLHFRLHMGLRNLCVHLGTFNCLDESSCKITGGFCAGINIDVKLFSFSPHIGNACSERPDDAFYFCLGFVIPNIIPFFRFEFRDDYCRLNGGKYDSSPWDIINHGATCFCDVDDALDTVPDDGLSSALMLSSHRPESAQIQVMSLTEEVSNEQANRWTQSLERGGDVIAESDWESFDPATGVRLVPKTEYLELNEAGQFILQPYCNRSPKITREDGLLIDSPDPTKGVMTEFRGYLLVKGGLELDTPSTADAAGRITLKIPQRFDYAYDYDADGNPQRLADNGRVNEWIFNHGLFRAGQLYSVAQRIATRRATLSPEEEEDNDTKFERKDADGSVYKKGWDIQTGLLYYTDSPATLTDRFPANDTTRLGYDTRYDRQDPNTSSGDSLDEIGGGSGPSHHDYDASAYPDTAVDNGIRIDHPTTGDLWNQKDFIIARWQPMNPRGDTVRIELIVLTDTTIADKINPNRILFGSAATQIFDILSSYTFDADNPSWGWEFFVAEKPSQIPLASGQTVSSDGIHFDLRCRFLITRIDNPAVFGLSAVFTIHLD